MKMKIVKVSEKGQIAIPQTIREEANIKKGDELVIIQVDDKILLEKAETVAAEAEDDFKDLLKLSEITLKKIWDNKGDDIWNECLKK